MQWNCDDADDGDKEDDDDGNVGVDNGGDDVDDDDDDDDDVDDELYILGNGHCLPFRIADEHKLNKTPWFVQCARDEVLNESLDVDFNLKLTISLRADIRQYSLTRFNYY